MKDLFQDIAVEQRAKMLQDNAYRVEEMDIKRPFTHEQLVDFKHELSEEMIQLNELKGKLDEIKKDFKVKMAPYEQKVKTILKNLKHKYEESEETVYLLDDQEANEMLIYDAQGMLLQTRKLMPGERQTVIRNLKTGTENE